MVLVKLEKFIKEKYPSKKAFANELDISRVHLHGIINGTKSASADLAYLIEKTTKGYVTMYEVLRKDPCKIAVKEGGADNIA